MSCSSYSFKEPGRDYRHTQNVVKQVEEENEAKHHTKELFATTFKTCVFWWLVIGWPKAGSLLFSLRKSRKRSRDFPEIFE